MNLVKEKWERKDIKEFQNYLLGLKNEDRVAWTKNILNTKMHCLALKSSVIKDIVKQISKGDYLSFLDLMIWEFYENTTINGLLIIKIKDFELMKKHLNIYSEKVDNWASCDTLSFKVNGNEEKFLNLAKEYRQSELPFKRRIAMRILFKLIDNENYIEDIFKLLNSYQEEKNYYVNMINAWLLCELFIKQRDKTIDFLKNHNLNDFTINKTISKCRDSYRVSKEDKDMLLKYKKVIYEK